MERTRGENMGSGVINHRGEILEVNGGFHENILYQQ